MKLLPLQLSITIMTAPLSSALDTAAIDALVAKEMHDWNIGGISIALVENGKTIYANGYGEATRNSVFRVGSVSKLFNAVAVMKEVERGNLDLDAPIPQEVLPLNPFPDQPQITLRHLLSHRSGLQRESSLGGYYDDSQPTLAATVASLRDSVLVTRPGEKTRYSNIGPSLAGYLVEKSAGISFEAYQREHLLGPLEMSDSAWTLGNVPEGKLVRSHMRVADGNGGWKRQETPVFDLGTIPAGNLYSTVDDLAKFAIALMSDGGGIISKSSLEEMWRPQFTEDSGGFGLGFMISKFGDHRMVSHNGAVYGHSTAFMVLPEAKLAVTVVANEDIANGRTSRIADLALKMLLNGSSQDTSNEPTAFEGNDDPARFAGSYESESFWAEITIENGSIVAEVSGQPVKLERRGPLAFRANSRLSYDANLEFAEGRNGQIGSFTYGGQTFRRVTGNPPALPKRWRNYLGSYGPAFIPLIVSERHGHLYAMTENMVDYRMIPINQHSVSLPPGMYVNEQAIFLVTPDGNAHSVDFANMVFPRNN
jgi:CubicO group peptidase (beta-lactamase class C family)